MTIEQRLSELNIELPLLQNKEYPFSIGTISGKLVFLSGQTPMVDGKMKYTGIVGSTVSIEEAQDAAVICTLNLLSALKVLIGDLNKVKRIIKLNGYVASEPNFVDQPLVINAASNLLNDIFGVEIKHARAAIGVAALPGGCPVEIEMIAELK